MLVSIGSAIGQIICRLLSRLSRPEWMLVAIWYISLCQCRDRQNCVRFQPCAVRFHGLDLGFFGRLSCDWSIDRSVYGFSHVLYVFTVWIWVSSAASLAIGRFDRSVYGFSLVLCVFTIWIWVSLAPNLVLVPKFVPLLPSLVLVGWDFPLVVDLSSALLSPSGFGFPGTVPLGR